MTRRKWLIVIAFQYFALEYVITKARENQKGLELTRQLVEGLELSGTRQLLEGLELSGTRQLLEGLELSGTRQLLKGLESSGTRQLLEGLKLSGTCQLLKGLELSGTRQLLEGLELSGTRQLLAYAADERKHKYRPAIRKEHRNASDASRSKRRENKVAKMQTRLLRK
jgi:hypothetical protein